MTERLSSDEIYQCLRERICLLKYPPATVLRETALADEFNVSRTPIRAVLQQLAHSGLIESRDGVGNLVTDLEFAEVRDIYEMRQKVAELIGQMNPLAFTEVHRDVIENLVERADALQVEFVIEAYWQINHELHQLITTVIGNSALLSTWDTLYYQAARIWYQDAQRDSSGVVAALQAELSEMQRAILQSDALALGYIQRNYIAYGLARLEQNQT